MTKSWISVFAVLGVVGGMYGCDSGDEDSEHCESWSYERGDCGPPWNEEEDWQECAVGVDQSPIDLHAAVLDQALEPLAVDYPPLTDPTIHNNGHTAQVDHTSGTLMLGERALKSLQFHVHVPAEHAVDGVRAAMEMHVVHVDDQGKPAAVVALRFDEGAENPELAKVWGAMPEEKGDATVSTSFDLAALLPDSLAYWMYSGSLTTPPCSEGLRWIVLEQTGTVSKAQVEAVRDRFGDNARALQPLNNRPIAEYAP